MATTKAQRVSIWIIVIVLTIGTFVSFFAIILSNKNTAKQQADINALTQQYQKDVATQTKQLSDQYYPTLNSYSSQIGKYSIGDTKDVATTDLKVGDGTTISENSTYSAYYIGWLPDGTIFDSSIDTGALKAPFTVNPGGVISGWTKGTIGMKVNGVREITMTAAEGYGSTATGKVPANSPLRFIVYVIPTPKTVPVPQALLDYYKTQGY